MTSDPQERTIAAYERLHANPDLQGHLALGTPTGKWGVLENAAKEALGDDNSPRALALLIEHTSAAFCEIVGHAYAIPHQFKVESGRFFIPAVFDVEEPASDSVAAKEFGISRAIQFDIALIELLWGLGTKGRKNAKKTANFIKAFTQDWPEDGSPEHAERIRQLWKPWSRKLVNAEPPPVPAPGDTDEQWEHKLNAWADSRKYAPMAPVKVLAEALWQARVRFMVEARPGGIVTGLHSDVITVMGRQTEMPLGESVMRDAKGREVADIVLVDASITEQMVRAGANLFGSLAGHKLINFVVLEAAARSALAEAGQLIRPDDLHIDGGMAGLCELLGLPTATTNREMLRNILRAGACLHWRTKVMDHQGSGWWGWNETIGRGRRRGELMITALAPLRPGFAAELSNRKQGRSADRKLVPELRHAPPLLSVRRNERGKVYTFGRLAVSSLVVHADQLPDGVRILDPDWLRMANEAGLPLGVVDRVLDGFIAGDDESPPLLKRDGDRYTLSDAHPVERQHIEALGEKVRRSRKHGRASAAKRGGNGKK